MEINIFVALHFTLLVLISLRILARHDLSSSARLAWLVILFILPYIGVVVYWMFGEIHLGRNFQRQHEQILDKLHSSNPKVLGDDSTLIKAIKPAYRAAFAYGANVTGYHITTGNRAELMEDATQTQARMISDFDAATDHIHVLYYIWLIDGMGIDTAEALIRAAKRGVTCRAMVDGRARAKWSTPKYGKR